MIKSVLAIETSCDDSSVAIVHADGRVERCLSAAQDEVHAPFGGIIPEIAARNHTDKLLPLIDECIGDLEFDGVAVTNRPGLIGSLMVGVVTGKTIAMSRGLPLIGVNHLEGHILAPFLYDEKNKKKERLKFPYLALAVSGGHSTYYLVEGIGAYKVLGTTRDDAAGEAFDKFAKMLGLGFPGGVQVDRLSQQGDSLKYQFPRAMMRKGNYELSFSGLKTAAGLILQKTENVQEELPHLCASFQQAVVDVLLAKLKGLVELTGVKQIVITGGVSANSRLRRDAESLAKKLGVELFMPPLIYCTDNAAMIGYAGIQRMLRGESSSMEIGPLARSLPEDFDGANR